MSKADRHIFSRNLFALEYADVCPNIIPHRSLNSKNFLQVNATVMYTPNLLVKNLFYTPVFTPVNRMFS